ncbi:MAG: helix-turn-helix transcriptional regulator [Acidobacteria bacterium]|nr:helix-turn-helix transcriptional regulator [Acidobacteriota bacterium]
MEEQILDFQEHLLEHLDEDWTVEMMAKKTGISLSHFPVAFKRVLKNSPAAWLKEKRLEKAVHLIETTYDHIDQIGIHVGIPDPSHFARDFKKKFRLTPTEYRSLFHKRHRHKSENGQE